MSQKIHSDCIEIGMRKTLGANKGQLFFQFWGESVLVFSAFLLGLLSAYLLIEPFQTLFNTRASFSNVIGVQTLLGFIVFLMVITLIIGGYPAMLLSKMGTLKALKGKIRKMEVTGYEMRLSWYNSVLRYF